jgi:hypothetical protein
MDIIRYIQKLDRSKCSPHQLKLLDDADKQLTYVRKLAAEVTLPIGFIIFLTGKHRTLTKRIFTALSVPVLGLCIAEAYAVNSWLIQQYLITKSQQNSD